jgi:hypothetical protein
MPNWFASRRVVRVAPSVASLPFRAYLGVMDEKQMVVVVEKADCIATAVAA